eukprot:563349-Rhodomonas_salina.1
MLRNPGGPTRQCPAPHSTRARTQHARMHTARAPYPVPAPVTLAQACPKGARRLKRRACFKV